MDYRRRKLAAEPDHLAMYDFDGTLFRSPKKPPFWTHPDPFGWAKSPVSLGPPCVPGSPPSSYWINESVSAAKKDSSDSSSLVVIVTARMNMHKRRIKQLLNQAGIRPNYSLFNPGEGANTFKRKVLGHLLMTYPSITRVSIWEDKYVDLYTGFVEGLAAKLGRDIKVEGHLIAKPRAKPTCDEDDVAAVEPLAVAASAVFASIKVALVRS